MSRSMNLRCRTWTARVSFVGCALQIAACSGDAPNDAVEMHAMHDGGEPSSDPSPNDDPTPDAPAQPGGDLESLAGRFTVSLIAADEGTGTPALSRLQGSVRDAPPHVLMGWLLAEEMGACRLETPDFPFCDPECAGGQGCVAGDTCVSDPIPVDVGTVRVDGLDLVAGESPVALSKIGPNYQPPGSVDIAFPPAAEGAELRLQASGSAYGDFEVVTHGIAELVPGGEQPIPLEREQPLTVRWTAASSASSRVTAVVDISHHGGVKGRILCNADDQRGELVVPAALVSGLYDLGFAGFPIVRLTRAAIGRTGDLEFAVEQTIEIDLAIPGVTSCLEATDCPDGQACQRDRTCG